MTSVSVGERIAAVLLIGSLLVLVSLVTSPDAEPSGGASTHEAPQAAAPPVSVAEATGVSEATAALDAQAARLRARLEQWPARPAPERNPFAFRSPTPAARRPASSAATGNPAADSAESAPAAPAEPAPPPLVAITADAASGTLLRQAVFAIDGRLEILTPGQKAGPFLVESISAESVTLVLGARTFHVAIR